MKKKSKRTLTPRLRFPEFRDKGEWEEARVVDVCKTVTQGGTPDTSNPQYWNGSINWITPAEMGKTDSPYIDSSERKITQAGLGNCSSTLLPIKSVIISTRAPIGHLAINDCPMAINQGCKGLIPGDRLLYFFLYCSLLSAKSRLNDMGAGNTFKELSSTALKNFTLPLPSPAEQQKIADCLSSLDELIAAEGRKLAALRDHKRGLMQQLFPQPGQTQPRLRFPEFRDKGEWCAAPLGDLFETMTGGTPDRAAAEYWDGDIPWVTTSLLDFNIISNAEEFISHNGLQNSSAKLFPKNTVLIALYGQGKTRGKVAMLGIEATSNQACAAILPGDRIEPAFTFLNLCGRYDEMRSLSNSGGQENLSQGLVRELPFSYPKDVAEQQKIADCLTALDTQITAQAAKIEALKQHKRGLMQQLFPSPEEE